MMRQAIGTAALTVVTAAATLALLSLFGPEWSHYLPATCLATHCFCELPRSGALVLQPVNSWSSFGFVLVGYWILLAPRSGDIRFGGWPAAWFGFTAIVIGVGSFLLHATLTLWGQFYDVLGMYLLSGFLIAYAVQRWRNLPNWAAVALYLAVCAVLIASLWIVPETRRWLFAIALVVAIALELIFARPHRPDIRIALFSYGLIANAVAFGIWILDNTRTVCAPNSWLQGHAIWHLLGAVAVYFNYLYYRSERSLAISSDRRG
jgi:Ceramidase